jgi:LysR family glycine cleavage system transcriptional activator
MTKPMKRFSRLPPLQCLVAFEAVARMGRGSLAAAELSVTPSAISHRLRQLEQLLGENLLRRIDNELMLTPRGVEYLDVVRECLESLSRYPVRGHSADERPGLSISAPPTFARQIIVPRLESFQAMQPDLELVLQLSVPLVGLKADDADVEIRFGNGKYPGLEVLTILDEPVFPVCSPAYLERSGPIGGLADLARATLLRCPLEPWRPWFRQAGLDVPEPDTGAQFIDLGLMVEAAINGQGIALARQLMAQPWLRSGLLVPVSDVSAKGQYAYYATWAAASPNVTHIESFLRWLVASLRQEI